jgi:hypothetical protein
MLRNQKKLARLLTASLAVAALAPATAGAVPIIDGNTVTQAQQGQSVAAGGGSGVTPNTLTAPKPQQHTAAKQDFPPTQPPANMPQWPLNPTPIATHNGVKASPKSSDDGLSTDTIVLLIIGGVALVAVAGLGLARARAGRQHKLA